MNRVLVWDILVILGFLMYFGCLFITKYTIVTISAMTDAAIQLESDPVTRQLVDMSYFSMMLMVISISFFGGLYFLIRRRYLRNPTEPNWQILAFYAIALFFLFSHNIVNDLPVLLKII